MTYETAAKIGHGCGMSDPAEFANNIVMHAMNLFPYDRIREEEAELRETARAAGVQFSEVCGDAVLAGESVSDPCYVCRKWQK